MSRRKQAKPRALKKETLCSDEESSEDTVPLGRNLHIKFQHSPTPSIESDGSSSDLDDDVGKYRCGCCGSTCEDLNEFLEHHDDCITRGSNGGVGGTATPPGSLRSLSGTPDDTMSPSPGSSSCCPTPSSSSGGGTGAGDPDSELSYTLGITENTPYGCQFCDRAFPRLSYLKRHEQVHSDQMPFRCDYCHRLFKHKRSRDRHVKLHTGDRKYRCTQCESAFSRSDHLKIHMKTHDNGKPYQCAVCNRGYNTAAALSSHMQNHKKTECQSELSAMRKNVELQTINELQVHSTVGCREESDSPEPHKPLVCSLCPQAFSSPEALREHLEQGHQAITPSVNSRCTKCQDEQSSPHSICIHKQNSNSEDQSPPVSKSEQYSPGARQLACGFCSRCDFPTFESLQLHVQVLHLSNYNAISPSSKSFDKHQKQRASTGSKSVGSTLSCEFCCQVFSTLSSLQKHALSCHSIGEVLSQNRNEDIYCSQCNMGFTSSSALLDHVNLLHEPSSTTNHQNNKRTYYGSRVRHNGAKHMKSSSILRNSPLALFNGSSSFYKRHVSENDFVVSTSGGQSSTPTKNNIQNTLLCSQCNAAFPDFESFRTHLKTHLDEAAGLGPSTTQRFMCPECDGEFDNEHLLDSHIIGHFLSSTTEYGCHSCFKLFQKPDDLQKHLLDMHSHHLYRCALCKQIFDSKVSIQVHFAVKHSNECRTFKCISCGAYFRSELEFQVHVKVSHLSNSDKTKTHQPFRCLLCDQVCPNESQLRYHVSTHKKPFPCSFCSEAYHVEFLLEKHVQTVHNQSRVPSSPPAAHPFLGHQQKNGQNSSGESMANNVVTTTDVAQNLTVKRLSNAISVKGEQKHSEIPRQTSPSPLAKSPTSAVPTSVSSGPNHDFRCDICDTTFSSESTLNSHRRQVHNIRTQKSTSGAQVPTLSLFCAYCNESCKSRHDLENHMKAHTATPTRHKCNICDEMCPSAATLAEHKLTHCKVVSGSTCIVCRVTLSTEEEFVSHMQQHNGSGQSDMGLPGPCIVCRQTLVAEVEMRMHAKFHAKNSGHFLEPPTHGSCCVCSRSFELGNLIIRALAKPSSSDILPHTYMCKECFHTKSGDASLQRCLDCGIKFESDVEMEAHMRCAHPHLRPFMNVDGKTYQCIKCQTTFESEAEIQAHVTCHVIREGTDHECRLCQKILDSPSKLQCHLIEHTFEGCPNFTCYICSSVFTGAHLLQQHMLEHGLDARPYDCDRCHHRFYFRAELENHSHIHNGEINNAHHPDRAQEVTQKNAHSSDDHSEDFDYRLLSTTLPVVPNLKETNRIPCKECGGLFATYTELQRHLTLSHSDTDIQCNNNQRPKDDFDSQRFRSNPKSDFSKTLDVREKRHGCPLCPKRFTRKENMRIHLKTHHKPPKESRTCPHCDLTFNKSIHLKEHIQTHHLKSSILHCETCEATFPSKRLLRKHRAKFHGHRPVECLVCGDEFDSTRDLDHHLDDQHQVRSFKEEDSVLANQASANDKKGDKEEVLSSDEQTDACNSNTSSTGAERTPSDIKPLPPEVAA